MRKEESVRGHESERTKETRRAVVNLESRSVSAMRCKDLRRLQQFATTRACSSAKACLRNSCRWLSWDRPPTAPTSRFSPSPPGTWRERSEGMHSRRVKVGSSTIQLTPSSDSVARSRRLRERRERRAFVAYRWRCCISVSKTRRRETKRVKVER